ncbi:hypothetical protein BMS3Abin07_01674 [bacterium BMS3Abin07]|nr:hypothetical protein BMS3Abin07_01674 [bacterium BMS3Abin07]
MIKIKTVRHAQKGNNKIYSFLLPQFKWIASVYPVVSSRGRKSEYDKIFFLTLDSLWSCHREDQLI